MLLLSSRAQDAFEDHENTDTASTRREIRPFSEFSATNALNRLATIIPLQDHGSLLQLGSDLSRVDARRRQAIMRLLGCIDGNAILSLGCINVLLSYLERRRTIGNVTSEEYLEIMVTSVSMFSVDRLMTITPDTMQALQIFDDESLPNASTAGTKHTRSLFRLLNFCRTANGKALLKQWFLMPSTDLPVLQARHDVIECILKPVNMHFSDHLCRSLRRCPDMRRSVDQLRQGRYGSYKGSEWHNVLNFSLHALKVKHTIGELQNTAGIELFQRILENFDPRTLESVGSLIGDVIDFDESEVEERIVVKRLVDDQLDDHKQVYDGIEQILNEACLELSGFVPSAYIEQVRCIYLPQLGFLTVMPAVETCDRSDADHVEPVWQSEDWDFHFSTSQNVYFKSAKMVEMDEYFGDVHSLVVDREVELLHQLQIRVLEHSDFLTSCSDIITELDCLLAFAEAAKKYKYVKPDMTEDNVLHVKRGRHPLQELGAKTFVENDIFCVGSEMDQTLGAQDTDRTIEEPEHPNLILLTGANYSGKSVYLRQAALIVYMAHIGSFVPAESATIGLTDRILTRIQTRESVAKAESAFLIDVQQVSLAVQLKTARSLLIIDEFGKGTDSIDGPALFGALVEHLTEHDQIRPRALLATHFHQVLAPGVLNLTKAVSLKHMQILIDREAEEISDQVTYLYQLSDGPSLASFGINCAALGGIAEPILARAEQLLAITMNGESLVAALNELTEQERLDLRTAERVARKFAEWDVSAESDDTLRSKLAEIVAG